MNVLKRNKKFLKELKHKRQFYEDVAIKKGDTDDYWATGFFQSLLIEAINQILKDVWQQQIIDIGCGDGRTVLSLVKQKNTVVGIDIAHTRLLRAQHKTEMYYPQILLVQSYAEDLPLKKEILTELSVLRLWNMFWMMTPC